MSTTRTTYHVHACVRNLVFVTHQLQVGHSQLVRSDDEHTPGASLGAPLPAGVHMGTCSRLPPGSGTSQLVYICVYISIIYPGPK
jgi:hypothetical protein